MPVLTMLAAMAAVSGGTASATSNQDQAKFHAFFDHWKNATDRNRPTAPAQPLSNRTGSITPDNWPSVTSRMGMRLNPVIGRQMFHAGVDLSAVVGESVRATADGRVTQAGWAGGYGLLVALRHADGYETRYAHLSRQLVAPGDQVRKGQLIGYTGSTGRSTGPHLHYEVRRDGRPLDPLALSKQTHRSSGGHSPTTFIRRSKPLPVARW